MRAVKVHDRRRQRHRDRRHEFAGEVRAARRVAAGLPGGRQDPAAAGRARPARARPARCWRSSTRRTTGWPPMPRGPRWPRPAPTATSPPPTSSAISDCATRTSSAAPNWSAAKPTLKAAQAQLEQAQAQLASQGNQAGYATLVADVAGVVTAVEAEPGQVVAAGTPVVRIAQDGPRDVVFSVPEDKVAALKRRHRPSRCAAGPAARRSPGKVREVAASADPVTRTYPVKVAIDAAQRAAAGRDGLRACRRRWRAAGMPVHQAADQRAAPGRQGHGGLGAGQADDDGAGRSRCRSPRPTATRP